jgi:hypothetical protein
MPLPGVMASLVVSEGPYSEEQLEVLECIEWLEELGLLRRTWDPERQDFIVEPTDLFWECWPPDEKTRPE